MTEFLNYGKPTSFLVEVIPGDGDYDLVSYFYPGALPDAWGPGVAVKVTPPLGGEWIGYFLQGKEARSAIDLCCIHPDGERLIVVAKGSGYVVSLSDPMKWEEIPFRPILGGRFDAESNTLVLFDYTRAFAINEQGYCWKTAHLSWDGLTEVEVRAGFLIGKGWDAASSELVPFEVRLSDGSHVGGASPAIG